MNGLEIDLDELEMFEKQLADKRKSMQNVSTNVVDQMNNSPDELDMYLDRLAIDISARDNAKNLNDVLAVVPVPSTSSIKHDDTVAAQNSMVNNNTCRANGIVSTIPTASLAVPKTSLPLLLFGLMSILVYINSVCYSKSDSQQ